MTQLQALAEAHKRATCGIVRQSCYVVYNPYSTRPDWRNRYETRLQVSVWEQTRNLLYRVDSNGKCYRLHQNDNGAIAQCRIKEPSP